MNLGKPVFLITPPWHFPCSFFVSNHHLHGARKILVAFLAALKLHFHTSPFQHLWMVGLFVPSPYLIKRRAEQSALVEIANLAHEPRFPRNHFSCRRDTHNVAMTCALKATLARRKDSSPPKCNKQMTWAATCDVHGHRPYAFSKKLDVFIVYRERRGGRTGWILVKRWCTHTQTLDKTYLVWLSFLSDGRISLYGQLIFTYFHGIRLGRDDLWRF